MNILNTVIHLRSEFYKEHGEYPKFVIVDAKHRDRIFSAIDLLYGASNAHLHYNDTKEPLNCRIYGMRLTFTSNIKDGAIVFTVPIEYSYFRGLMTQTILDFDNYCKQNHIDYMEEIYKNNTSSNEMVEFPKSFMYELSCFLLASSHRADEGELPYPAFQNLSHELSHQISDALEISKDVYQSSTYTFEKLWKEYND